MALLHARLGNDIGNLIGQSLNLGRFLTDISEGVVIDTRHVVSSSEE